MSAREFELGDLISVTTGRLVSRRHVGGLYDLMGFMVGESLMTHQLPRAMDACKPELLRQHPWLAGIEVPDWSYVPRDRAETIKTIIFGWLDGMDMTHGKTHLVEAGAPTWQRMDALAELDQMAGTRPVITVRVP